MAFRGNSGTVFRVFHSMEYLDVLRRNGWIADPTDKVRVTAVHDMDCPAAAGRSCWCSPRLVLTAECEQPVGRDLDRDAPLLDMASGE
jgi:hypothetical protein